MAVSVSGSALTPTPQPREASKAGPLSGEGCSPTLWQDTTSGQVERALAVVGIWAAMLMTQQYLAGELSVLLAQLQGAADQPCAGELDQLRQQAETVPAVALRGAMARSLSLTEALCWDSLTRGNMPAFRRYAEVSAQLHEFGVCAGLLPDG